jgi:hypothetical protein
MNIKKQKIERVRITFSNKERESVDKYLKKHGYTRLLVSGPIIRNMRATNRYEVIYEKRVRA